jgi:hypothetical protein
MIIVALPRRGVLDVKEKKRQILLAHLADGWVTALNSGCRASKGNKSHKAVSALPNTS